MQYNMEKKINFDIITHNTGGIDLKLDDKI
jgi:hypothetical protein